MRLRCLGPVEIVADGEARPAGSPRERIVLSVLALGHGRPVPLDRLVQAVWAEDPPATARTQIQICVSALRRRGVPIATHDAGYLLAADLDVDIDGFDRQVAAAAAAADSGDVATAAETLRGALEAWRGSAFADVDSEWVRRAAARLEERRVAAVEERVSMDLTLGRHREVLGELYALVDELPLREGLHALLMVALYRCGRQADALAAYRRARDVLVREVGVEPGRRLRELERAVLAGDPALDPPAPATPAAVAPVRQLPAAVPDLSGREAPLAWAKALLGDDRPTGAPPVVGIYGMGGVGKSALAVRIAHELADRYPDGQLYVDAHQDPHQPGRPRTVAVLGRFLRALGMADALVPDDPAELAERYRSRLAGRRVLVVLDGVADGEDVTPLLPGEPGCAVIVTSRARLSTPPGIKAIHLDVLPDEPACDVLGGIIGHERIAAEPEAARDLVRACDGLPLALRIVGAKLASRPHWSLHTLVRRLGDERFRLDELTYRGVEVRSTIAMSCAGLGPASRRLFRRLAVSSAPDVPDWASAAVSDAPPRVVEDALAELVDAQLVHAAGGAGEPDARYRRHDLVRAYAAELLAEEEPSAERDAALRRLLGGWLTLATAAHRREYGDLADLRSDAPRWTPPAATVADARADPMAWLERERLSLVAAVDQAADAGWAALCWELALASALLFEVKGCFDDWRIVVNRAGSVADKAGDRLGSAAMRYSSGALLVHQGRPDEAEQALLAALAGFRELDHDHGAGLVLRQLAVVQRLHDDRQAARASSQEALRLLHAAGDRSAEAHTRSVLARLDMDDGDLPAAHDQLAEAVRLARTGGTVRTEAQILYRVADLAMLTNQHGEARDALEQVLTIARSIGDRVGVAYARYGLGRLERAAGRPAAAVVSLQDAVSVAELTGDRNLEARATRMLGELAAAAGDADAATRWAARSRDLFGRVAATAGGVARSSSLPA